MRRLVSHVPAVATLVACSLAASMAVATVAGAASTPSGSSTGHPFPVAAGSVAAITGSSMEVQNPQTGQVTVTWTTSTTVSQTVTVAATSVTVGDCVTVVGTTSKKSKEVTAKTVSISQPSSSGTCSARTGGGFIGGGSGGASGRFQGAPTGGGTFHAFRSGSGSGGPPASFLKGRAGAFANMGFASGKVTAVSSGAMTVTGFSSASLSPPKSTKKGEVKKGSGSRPSFKTTKSKVALSSSTSYTETQSAASSDLAVGDCVTAAGSSNSTGAITASTIRITSTGNKSCTTGFFAARGAAGG